MEKFSLFLVLLALVPVPFSAHSLSGPGFLERRPGSSLLTRRTWDETPRRQDRYTRVTEESEHSHDSPQDSQDHHPDSHDNHKDSHDQHPDSNKNADMKETMDKADDRFEDALEGDPNAPGPQLPEMIPTSFDGASKSFNALTDNVEEGLHKIPGAGLLINKDGLFGDFMPPDEGEGEAAPHEEPPIENYVTWADNADELPPNVEELLTIDLGDTGTLEKSYISIAGELREYENTYIDCLDKLSDLDFTKPHIEACTGPQGRYVGDDIEYFKQKILGRTDAIIRSRMIENCFKVAGVDLAESAGCDLLQRDMLDLLWAELNYYATVDYHRNKYIFEQAALPADLLDNILSEFKALYAKQSDLMVELYNHKTLTVQRVRDYVADRLNYLEDVQEERGPLEREPLSANKILKIDGAAQKLKRLDELRSGMSWQQLMPSRKTQAVSSKPVTPFQSPWTNANHLAFGRGPLERVLQQTATAPAAQAIEQKINQLL